MLALSMQLTLFQVCVPRPSSNVEGRSKDETKFDPPQRNGGKREPGNEAISFIQVLLYLWCVVYNCHSTICNSSFNYIVILKAIFAGVLQR